MHRCRGFKVLPSGKTCAPAVEADDRAFIGKYSGSEVTLDGNDHIVLREDDVFGILER